MGRRTGRPPGRTPVYASEAERRAARTRRDKERKRRSVHVGRHKERWDAAKKRAGTARDEDFAGLLLALLDRADAVGGDGAGTRDVINAAKASGGNALTISKTKANQTRIKSESADKLGKRGGRTSTQNGSDVRPFFKECATSKPYKQDDDSGDESLEAEDAAEENEDENGAAAAAGAAVEDESESKHSTEEGVAADEGKSSSGGSSSSSASNQDDDEVEEDDGVAEPGGTAGTAAVAEALPRDAYEFGGSDDNAEEGEGGACGECGSSSSVESESDWKGAKDVRDDDKPKTRKYQKKEPVEPTARKVRRKTKQTDADGLPVLYHCTQPGCEKAYRVKEYLTNHVKAVHGDRKLVCGVQGCGKRFVLPRHLKKHQLLHSDERNFVCETCGASFKSKKNLLIHLRIHTGEKPLQCELCGYRCRQKASLNWHMRKHNIELSFSFTCDLCGKRFEKSDNLRCHQLKSHPDREPENPPYHEPTSVQPHVC